MFTLRPFNSIPLFHLHRFSISNSSVSATRTRSSAHSNSMGNPSLNSLDNHAWMSSNRLSLNTGKTQFIWFGTWNGLAKRDTHQLSNQSPSLVELTTVKNLGFALDQELSMKDHVSKLCQSCYLQLRQLRTIRHSLSPSAIRTLVNALICSRIDFSNSLLYGTSTYLLDRLQSVLNSSARLILRLGKYDPISAAIRRELHWLPIQARIRFKMNAITRNCLVGQAPEYLAELCRPINEVPARRKLRSAAQVQLLVLRFRKEHTGRRGFSISSPQLEFTSSRLSNSIRGASSVQKETENSSHAAVHFSPLRIYVTSATSTTTTTTTTTRPRIQ